VHFSFKCPEADSGDFLSVKANTRKNINKIFEESKDPWKHRSQGMRCSTCMWFAPKSEAIGRCRRHAPTMNGYPAVYTTDWCGDHKVDEEKL